jgi:hypothetical protein
MSDGRGKFEWQQTSSMLAVIAGIMHDPKKGKAPSPDDFNPYAQRQKRTVKHKAPLSVLRDIFCKGKKEKCPETQEK